MARLGIPQEKKYLSIIAILTFLRFMNCNQHVVRMHLVFAQRYHDTNGLFHWYELFKVGRIQHTKQYTVKTDFLSKASIRLSLHKFTGARYFMTSLFQEESFESLRP